MSFGTFQLVSFLENFVSLFPVPPSARMILAAAAAELSGFLRHLTLTGFNHGTADHLAFPLCAVYAPSAFRKGPWPSSVGLLFSKHGEESSTIWMPGAIVAPPLIPVLFVIDLPFLNVFLAAWLIISFIRYYMNIYHPANFNLFVGFLFTFWALFLV